MCEIPFKETDLVVGRDAPSTLRFTSETDTISYVNNTPYGNRRSSRLCSITRTSIASDWKSWFLRNSTSCSNPFDESIVSSVIEEYIEKEHIMNHENYRYLQIAFVPTSIPALDYAQCRVLSCFFRGMTTDGDALTLRSFVSNRLLCCMDRRHSISLSKYSEIGSFFRLLLLYFNPRVALQLDCHYTNWEKSISLLFYDPCSYLSDNQLLLLMEPLRFSQYHSMMWMFLWAVETMSQFCGDDSFSSIESFDVFLKECLCSFNTVPYESLYQYLRGLPNSSNEYILQSLEALSSQPLFSLQFSFSDIVGPVLTTENRRKKSDSSSVHDDYVVLDIRKAVSARNEFVNATDGCIQAKLYSSVSPDRHTCIHYLHIPYSSTNTENNQYYRTVASFNEPLIILSDMPSEASVIALILQKQNQSLVSVSSYDHTERTYSFPQLLDILLSCDNTTPKAMTINTGGVFSGWTWWKSRNVNKESMVSSSDYYRSISTSEESKEEKIIVVNGNGKKEADMPAIDESHNYTYFNQIHECMLHLLSELEETNVDSCVQTSLLQIIKPLLYMYPITIVSPLMRGSHEDSLENTGIIGDFSSVHLTNGNYLMVLTDSALYFLTDVLEETSQTHAESEKETESKGFGREDKSSSISFDGFSSHEDPTLFESTIEDSDSLEVSEEAEATTIIRIIESIEKYGYYIQEGDQTRSNADWLQLPQLFIKDKLSLKSITSINAAMWDEEKDQQTIHICDKDGKDIYFCASNAIVVVNELLQRIEEL